MNTIEIEDKGIFREVPDHWDHLHPNDVDFVLKMAMSVIDGHLDELEARIRIFYRIAGIKRNWKSIALERIMSNEWLLEKNANIYALSEELTSWVFDIENDQLQINYNTVMNHFPTFGKLTGPGHMIANCSFGEFRAALEELDEYFALRKAEVSIKEQDYQLSRFIACLYRKNRKEFNREDIDQDARICQKMSAVQKIAILLWFTYCIKYFQENELIISGRTISLRPLFPKPKGKNKPKRDDEGSAAVWSSILFQIAKDGVFGKVDHTDKVGLYDVLLYMYEQYRENRRIKMQNKKKS
ncbi:MAG: hypothetical protein RIC03_12545 [Cyclobacteriaceae bacterium]